MPTKMNLLDAAVLSLIGTVWLAEPAYLEAAGRPFAAVASASLVEMPVVLAMGFLWCFVVRGRLAASKGSSGQEWMGRLLFFGFMAFFWSLVDDGPVNFDSVLTWPEVTGGPQHLFLEVLLHALTLGFLCLGLREALRGSSTPGGRTLGVALLGGIAFWASYFQNTPYTGLENLPPDNWYVLDAVEHLVAVAALWLAVRESGQPARSAHNA